MMMSLTNYDGDPSHILFPEFFETMPQRVQENIKKTSTRCQKMFYSSWQKRSIDIPHYMDKLQIPKLYHALEQGLYVCTLTENAYIRSVVLECLHALFLSKENNEENLYITVLKILPSLSVEQLAILALLFIVTETSRTFFTHKEFVDFLQKSIVDLYNLEHTEEHYFSLLRTYGLVYTTKTKHQFITTLRHHYTVFFDKGFNTLALSSFPEYKSLKQKKFIIRSFTNTAYEQFGFLNIASLEHHNTTGSITETEYEFILKYSEETRMDLEESRSQLIKMLPSIQTIIDTWHTSPYQDLQLSFTGKILAIAYLKSLGHQGYAFSTWVYKTKNHE
ncbi:MAG: LPO_1073/Vpar_1526 family protein [Desulfovibrionaceae bacterium]